MTEENLSKKEQIEKEERMKVEARINAENELNQKNERTKKPVWKKWWFWVIAAFIFFMIMGIVSEEPKEKAIENEVRPELESEIEPDSNSEPESENERTIGEKNALKSAQNYLKNMAFSREGLIEQLEYEGFTRQQAEYGVQVVGY
jgi:hypothetical protein